ncbi:MAG: hypothetical protein HY698_00635 [Deltaproteobacteria bacterium]|nr:hypothetical protein [Deltaproteobacteria bacterium]
MTKPPHRERVVGECCGLVDEEVKSKGGLTGIAVKGAYAMVKAIKPKFISEVVDGLLDEWVAKLEPFYGDWQASGKGKPLGDFLAARSGAVAEKLLEVTDARAGVTTHSSVKKMYEKLRPAAKKHVEEAVPRLGKVVEGYAD